jgi:hypothetical protein
MPEQVEILFHAGKLMKKKRAEGRKRKLLGRCGFEWKSEGRKRKSEEETGSSVAGYDFRKL